MKKPLKSQSGGAKAPSLLSNITGADLQRLAESVSTLLRERSIDTPLSIHAKPAGALQSQSPAAPPWKPRLEAIHFGLTELLNNQRGFQQYLNPVPQDAGGSSKTEGCPSGMEELLSSIEHLANTNLLTFNDIRNKF